MKQQYPPLREALQNLLGNFRNPSPQYNYRLKGKTNMCGELRQKQNASQACYIFK